MNKKNWTPKVIYFSELHTLHFPTIEADFEQRIHIRNLLRKQLSIKENGFICIY